MGITKPLTEAVAAFASYTSDLDTIQQFIDDAYDTEQGLQYERSEFLKRTVCIQSRKAATTTRRECFILK